MSNELCCVVNPCYICTPCGFQECEDHWVRTQHAADYHFVYDKGERHCKVTGTVVDSVEVDPTRYVPCE